MQSYVMLDHTIMELNCISFEIDESYKITSYIYYNGDNLYTTGPLCKEVLLRGRVIQC